MDDHLIASSTSTIFSSIAIDTRLSNLAQSSPLISVYSSIDSLGPSDTKVPLLYIKAIAKDIRARK